MRGKEKGKEAYFFCLTALLNCCSVVVYRQGCLGYFGVSRTPGVYSGVSRTIPASIRWSDCRVRWRAEHCCLVSANSPWLYARVSLSLNCCYISKRSTVFCCVSGSLLQLLLTIFLLTTCVSASLLCAILYISAREHDLRPVNGISLKWWFFLGTSQFAVPICLRSSRDVLLMYLVVWMSSLSVVLSIYYLRVQLYINGIADRLVRILRYCLRKRTVQLSTGELSDSLGFVLRRRMISALWYLMIIHMLRTPCLINLHIQRPSLSLYHFLLSWLTLISRPWSSDSGRHQLNGFLRMCIMQYFVAI